MMQDNKNYKKGWILYHTNRVEGWGSSQVFDSYEHALQAVYNHPNVEHKILSYRYQLEEDSSLNDCGDNE